MNCRSSDVDEPQVSDAVCDGCGNKYEELSVLVWGRDNGLIGLLFCLECDPTSKVPPKLVGGYREGRLQ